MTLSWDIHTNDDIPSTQDLCKTRAADGAAEGLVVQALSQSAGKGRHGREWVSGEGNLAFSFILRPECDVRAIGQLSILVGVALAKAIGAGARLKWPNDVLVDGRKCAGILIDSDLSGGQVDWLVVGVGVNTAQAPDEAAALGVERDAFLQTLLQEIATLYKHWQGDGFEDIRKAWIEGSYPRGTMLNVGVFEDLDALGNLVVLDEQGARRIISAGDVYIKDKPYVTGD